MAKPDLGTKRACVACSARFYDMAKSPAICPKCGTEQPIDQPRPHRSAGNVVDDQRPKKPAVAPGIEDVDVEVEGVEDVEEEDVLEVPGRGAARTQDEWTGPAQEQGSDRGSKPTHKDL